MKRILQVVYCLAKGGTEAFIMNNFRHINRQKYVFDFLVMSNIVDSSYRDEIEALGGNIYQCMPPAAVQLRAFIKNAVSIMRDHGPYDAMHVHVNIANAWVLYAAYKAGIEKRISHSHDTSGKGTKKIYRYFQMYLINKYSTVKLACSELAGEYLYGKKTKDNKWSVIHNGIDVTRFIEDPEAQVEKLRQGFNIENCKYVFGNITRFEEKKNIKFVVDVFQNIIKKIPDSVLLLGGVDGGQLNEIKKKVTDCGLSNYVRFIGVRNDIEVCLDLIDIYIFPSRYEGLGIALLEAQASGVFCVSSNRVPEEVDMGLNLIEFVDLKRSAAEWSDIIISKLNYDRPGKEEIVQKFRKYGYDINDSVKRLADIYE